MKVKQVYQFKKGEMCSLDQIYPIQGLEVDGQWWKHADDGSPFKDCMGDELSEVVEITRDVKITIIVEHPDE